MARTLLSAPPTERVGRYPKHTFRVNSLPYTAQPVFIHPVLPGETMTSLYMESRCVSDPVKSPIIGWKKEYVFFYVRMSNLMIDAIKEMFVDPTNTDLLATYGAVANVPWTYTAKGGIDWLARCMTAIIEGYFRDEGETMASHVTSTTLAGTPIVQIREQTWLDSATDDADFATGAAISSATNADDLDRLMDAFAQLRALGIADMTYEDFLRSYGIAVPNKDEAKPEELWRASEFQYPSNTVNPVDGVPASAVSWVFKNGERKPKFFSEPGFVVGISVTRPKIYFAGLAGKAMDFMGRAWDWMPNYLATMPETSLKNFAADTGPLGDRTTPTNSYWLDMRDILLHGDQFQNVLPFNAVPAGDGANHFLALPPGDLSDNAWKYPSEEMCKSFFVSETDFFIKQDGYVSLSIKGKQVDYTVGNLAQM